MMMIINLLLLVFTFICCQKAVSLTFKKANFNFYQLFRRFFCKYLNYKSQNFYRPPHNLFSNDFRIESSVSGTKKNTPDVGRLCLLASVVKQSSLLYRDLTEGTGQQQRSFCFYLDVRPTRTR